MNTVKQIQVQPLAGSMLKGTYRAVASKSVSQRALACALLRKAETRIANFGYSNDENAALAIIRQLGACIREEEDILVIDSSAAGFSNNKTAIHCEESGLSLRMFIPVALRFTSHLEVSLAESLSKRPHGFIKDVLSRLNIEEIEMASLPYLLKGYLSPKTIELDASVSSQFLSGLLMAYASMPHIEPIHLQVRNLVSKPYIDLTLSVLEQFKFPLPDHNNYEQFTFIPSPGQVPKTLINFTIEGDWSGAAFFMVAAAIAGDVTVKGMDVFTTQGDKALLQALMDCGCRMSIEVEQIHIRNQGALQAFQFDAADCPDLFPPLVALAAFCTGKSVIEGVNRLAHKESSRAFTLQEEFAKMGITITLQDDLMIIEGVERTRACTVDSHNDHRIAMACAIAALKADGAVTITNAQAVAKSYPKFFEHLANLGVSINQE